VGKLGEKCILCNNLIGKQLGLNEDLYEACRCKLGLFDRENVEWYYTAKQLLRSKSVSEIEGKCKDWDYRLKGKLEGK